MEDVVIVSGVRTPIGQFQGAYSNLSASDLGAIVIKEAVERAGLKPEQVRPRDPGLRRPGGGGRLHLAPCGREGGHADRDAGADREPHLRQRPRGDQHGGALHPDAATPSVVVAGGAENMTMMPYYLRKARAGYRMGNGVDRGRHPAPARRPVQQAAHGHHGGEPRREVRGVARGAGRVSRCARRSAPRRRSPPGKFKDEIVPVEVKQGKETVTIDTGRAPAPDDGGGAREAEARVQRRRHGDGGQRQRHQRRRRGGRRDERGEGDRSSA